MFLCIFVPFCANKSIVSAIEGHGIQEVSGLRWRKERESTYGKGPLLWEAEGLFGTCSVNLRGTMGLGY